MQKCHTKPANVENIVQKRHNENKLTQQYGMIWKLIHLCYINVWYYDDLELKLSGSLYLKSFKIFRKSFLRYFMRVSAVQETTMYKMHVRTAVEPDLLQVQHRCRPAASWKLVAILQFCRAATSAPNECPRLTETTINFGYPKKSHKTLAFWDFWW